MKYVKKGSFPARTRLLRAGEDRLRLPERLDLLVAGLLANVEVLQREVAGLVEVGVLVGELLSLIHGRLLSLFGRNLVRVGIRLLLGLLRDAARLLLNGLVRVLDVRLVGLLRIGLGLDRLGLEGLRVADDLLHHPHNTTGTRGLLVLLEARRRRAGRLAHLRAQLQELLIEDRLQDVEGLVEELLRGALIRDGGLEVLVLHLAVLARALELRLHLRDLGLERGDSLGKLVDLRGEVRDLRLELRDVALLQLRLALVRVQALGAEILVLDLVGLLLEERLDHLIDGRLDLGEGVEAHARREGREARVRVFLRSGEEHLRRRVAGARCAGAHTDLDKVEGPREGVVRVVRGQDGERLADALDLLRTGLLALLPLLVRHLARLLQVHEELLARGERVPRVLEVRLRVHVLLVGVCKLLGLGVLKLRTGLDLRFLRRLEGFVIRLRLHLLLLGAAEVRLERLLHLLEDAEDLARLRSVALLERRLRIEVVTGGLDERRDHLVLARRHHAAQQRRVPVELPLEHRRDVDELLRGNLEEGVVLREHNDRGLERANGLQHVLLLLVELGELLLAHRRGLVQGLLVLRDLRLEVLDLRVELRARRGELLDRGRQVRDVSLRIRDGRGLLLVVGLAPARHLLVSLLILLSFLLKLGLHVLKQVDDLGHGAVLFIKGFINRCRFSEQGRCFRSNEQAQKSKHLRRTASTHVSLEPK